MAIVALNTTVFAVERSISADDAVVIQGADAPLLAQMVLHWFDQRDTPAFVILDDLVLLGANAEGRRMLEERSVLQVADGRVSFVQGAQTEALRAFLQAMGSNVGVWPSASGDGDGFDVFRVQRLNIADQERAVFGVTLVSPEIARVRHWADLSVAFPVTRTEERIAKQLFEGLSVNEIAEETGTSIETVRTHIRRIYQKTGVASREKLQAVLSPFQTL